MNYEQFLNKYDITGSLISENLIAVNQENNY